MKHRGEIVEKVARSSGIAISEIAKKMKYERTAPYQHFKKKDLDYGIILSYGKVLKHDFSKEIPEIVDFISTVSEPLEDYNTLSLSEALKQRDNWRDKYLTLLEKYTELLEGKNGNDK